MAKTEIKPAKQVSFLHVPQLPSTHGEVILLQIISVCSVALPALMSVQFMQVCAGSYLTRHLFVDCLLRIVL